MWKRKTWRGLHRDGPGRVRLRLAKLLEGIGVKVDPYDLWCQEGGYRHHNWDLACWGAYSAEYKGEKVHLCSWDTMTKCVRFGVEIVGWWTETQLEICRKS